MGSLGFDQRGGEGIERSPGGGGASFFVWGLGFVGWSLGGDGVRGWCLGVL